MARPKTIGPQLTALAFDILDAVKGDDVALETKLDAFKILTTYHVSTARAAKHIAEEPDDDSIVSLKERIAAVGRKAG